MLELFVDTLYQSACHETFARSNGILAVRCVTSVNNKVRNAISIVKVRLCTMYEIVGRVGEKEVFMRIQFE